MPNTHPAPFPPPPDFFLYPDQSITPTLLPPRILLSSPSHPLVPPCLSGPRAALIFFRCRVIHSSTLDAPLFYSLCVRCPVAITLAPGPSSIIISPGRPLARLSSLYLVLTHLVSFRQQHPLTRLIFASLAPYPDLSLRPPIRVSLFLLYLPSSPGGAAPASAAGLFENAPLHRGLSRPRRPRRSSSPPPTPQRVQPSPLLAPSPGYQLLLPLFPELIAYSIVCASPSAPPPSPFPHMPLRNSLAGGRPPTNTWASGQPRNPDPCGLRPWLSSTYFAPRNCREILVVLFPDTVREASFAPRSSLRHRPLPTSLPQHRAVLCSLPPRLDTPRRPGAAGDRGLWPVPLFGAPDRQRCAPSLTIAPSSVPLSPKPRPFLTIYRFRFFGYPGTLLRPISTDLEIHRTPNEP